MATLCRMVRDNRKTVKVRFERELATIIQEATEEGAKYAKTIVPVRTGDLRDSIEPVKIDRFRWQIVAGLDYATFVEFGTTRSGPQPFLMPAFMIAKAYIATRKRTLK